MNKYLPVILLKGLVVLPHQEVRLELNNELSKNVIMLSSSDYKNEVLVVCPTDQREEEPSVADLPIVGVVAKVKSKIELPNGNLRIVLSGQKRVSINEYLNEENNPEILISDVSEIILPKFNKIEEIAVQRKLIELLTKYINKNELISNSILNTIKDEKDLNKLTDMITCFLPFPVEKKLEYMATINALKRAHALIEDISVEIEVSVLDAKIDDKIREELENNQKDFILKEKIKEIKNELGETSGKEEEISFYKEQLASLDIPDKIKNRIANDINKYEFTPDLSPEASVVRTYLDWILNLPWNDKSIDEKDLNKVRSSLNKSHYGLEKIKDRIVEYVAVKQKNPNIKSPIICLVGPPGVGKTTLAMSIASALNKEFYKISVGGLSDSAELLGHRKTYLGSAPGKIIQGLRKCHTNNPVMLIDEIDKMVSDYKGDPSSALLDILDKEQNTMFVDNYIEEPFDLHDVMFIVTANNMYDIPDALFDRLEVLELASYTEFEKLDIAKKYLIPSSLENHQVLSKELKISDQIIKILINNYTKEAGVRELSRLIDTIVRKVVTSSVIDNTPIKKSITKEDVKSFLGSIKYSDDNIKNINAGTVKALAYTPIGGVVMPIETVMYEGSGKTIITGSLGEVMKESINVAVSYIKNNLDYFKISDYYFRTKDIHIHALAAAIKKDGPSAGAALTTALLSLFKNYKLDKTTSMTGEISLNGEILKIGGLKEKIIGAYNDNIKTIFIPFDNEADLEEIPSVIKEKITIIPVKNYQEIYNQIFK